MADTKNRQTKGNLTPKQQRERDRAIYLRELDELRLIKRLYETADGSRFMTMLLRKTNPMAPPKDKDNKIGFLLGVQSIGRWLVQRMTDAGVPLKLTDFIENINIGRINELEGNITQLNKEEVECQK